MAQIGFAIGAVGSFGRGEIALATDASLTGTRALLRIQGVASVWLLRTYVGGVDCDQGQSLFLKYRDADGIQTGPLAGTGPQTQYNWDTGTRFQTRYCDAGQVLELRGRLGTLVDGVHQADGYLELRLGGVVAQRLDNLSLGIPGVEGFSQVGVYPAGTYVFPASDGSGVTDEHGGLISFYLNLTDQYGAGGTDARFNYAFAQMTDATLFDSEGWTRDTPACAPGGVPTIWGGKLSDSAEGCTSRGSMTSPLLSSTPSDPPPDDPVSGDIELCPPCVDADPDIVNDGGGDDGEPPWIQPLIGQQDVCAGGGLVPTQPDLVHSEQWWGM